MPKRFCLDTSLFINAWRKHYRPDVFPSFWAALDKLITENRIRSCWEVYNELQQQRDDLFAWVKVRKAIFEKPANRHISAVKKLMDAYPNFAAAGGSKNGADPWIIAHAKCGGLVVVTDEQHQERPKPTKPPKIPNVCNEIGVDWCGPVDFLKNAGITI